MKSSRFLLAAPVVLIAPDASARTVKTDDNKSTDFTEYKTFAFGKGTPAAMPFNQERIEFAIKAELTSRGMPSTDGDADILVYTHVQHSQETRVDVDRLGYGGHPGWGGWGAKKYPVAPAKVK